MGRLRKHCIHRAITVPLPSVPQLWDAQVCLNPLFMCFINVGLWDFQRSQVSVPAWELVTARVLQGFTWLTSPLLIERYGRYGGDFPDLFSGGNCACTSAFLLPSLWVLLISLPLFWGAPTTHSWQMR